MARQSMHGIGAVLALGLLAGLTGCDYWPPALQTQIEQLRSELQMTTAEKAQLQTQLSSLTKVKDDLQAQVDELSRANRDKSTLIASLQSSITALQERVNKSAKPAPKGAAAKAPATKPHAKVAPKPSPVKKKLAGTH